MKCPLSKDRAIGAWCGAKETVQKGSSSEAPKAHRFRMRQLASLQASVPRGPPAGHCLSADFLGRAAAIGDRIRACLGGRETWSKSRGVSHAFRSSLRRNFWKKIPARG